VLNTKLLDNVRREYARGEGSPENLAELFVKTSNSKILEVEVWLNQGIGRATNMVLFSVVT
jgi:hypothetical protein